MSSKKNNHHRYSLELILVLSCKTTVEKLFRVENESYLGGHFFLHVKNMRATFLPRAPLLYGACLFGKGSHVVCSLTSFTHYLFPLLTPLQHDNEQGIREERECNQC